MGQLKPFPTRQPAPDDPRPTPAEAMDRRRRTQRLAVISFRSTDEIDGRLGRLAKVLGLSKSDLLETMTRRFLVAQGSRRDLRPGDRNLRTQELVTELSQLWKETA